jgi:type VI secretion system secreted protein Hcp
MVCVSSAVRRRIAVMVLAGATLIPIPCAAVFDAFLDVPGIPGESTSPLATGQIDVVSFGSSVTPAKIFGSGCGGREGKIVNAFFVTKQIDKSSPKLYLAAAKLTNFPTVTLRAFRADPVTGTPVNFLTITLTDAVVSSINGGGAESDVENPLETVAFAYAAIQYDYAKPGGTPADASSAAWTTNCKGTQ